MHPRHAPPMLHYTLQRRRITWQGQEVGCSPGSFHRGRHISDAIRTQVSHEAFEILLQRGQEALGQHLLRICTGAKPYKRHGCKHGLTPAWTLTKWCWHKPEQCRHSAACNQTKLWLVPSALTAMQTAQQGRTRESSKPHLRQGGLDALLQLVSAQSCCSRRKARGGGEEEMQKAQPQPPLGCQRCRSTRKHTVGKSFNMWNARHTYSSVFAARSSPQLSVRPRQRVMQCLLLRQRRQPPGILYFVLIHIYSAGQLIHGEVGAVHEHTEAQFEQHLGASRDDKTAAAGRAAQPPKA